jgi:hypothetical protein
MGWNCGVTDRDKHEPTVQRSQRNPDSIMKDICLWSHNALIIVVNVSLLSSPLPLTAYELICHSSQISQHYHKTQTPFTGLKPKLDVIRWHVQLAPNFIAQDHHSQQEPSETKKFRKRNRKNK